MKKSETQTEEKVSDEIEKTAEEKSTEEKPAEAKPEEKTEKFREVKHSANQSDTVYSQPVTMFDATSAKRSDLKTGNKSSYFIGAVIGGIIIVFGLIYLLFFNSSSEIVVPEKPYDEVISESQQRYEEKPGTVSDTSQARSVSSDSLNLLIMTTDTSWVKIIFDDSAEQEFILFPNSQKAIEARDNFKITFGKSLAIKLQLNNKPLAFNPKSTVSYVMINSKGLEYLKKPPEKGINNGDEGSETN